MAKEANKDMTLSIRLKTAMEARGVNQAWVAAEADTPMQNVSRYVLGQTYSESLLIIKRIAIALNVSMDYLVGLTDEMRPAQTVERDVGEFERKYSHIFTNPDFQMYVDVYNRLQPKPKAFLIEFVRAYGINQNVLASDGKTPDMPE